MRKVFQTSVGETANTKRCMIILYDTFHQPPKNADLLMQIGEELSENYGVPYLPSEFKKKNGYKRSIELSREYDLYRQDFCGCRFSKKAKEDMRCE
ncbi:MAG: epoxyqueuosine reductase QueH [Clostridium sp.]